MTPPLAPLEGANYYQILGLAPSAAPGEIRAAYWRLCKVYHPDITDLPAAVAVTRFQQVREAYTTLIDPRARQAYDCLLKSGQPPGPPVAPVSVALDPLDPKDRPLSAGEVFALLILGLTFLACLALAVILGFLESPVTA